jgi:hypothetical protein
VFIFSLSFVWSGEVVCVCERTLSEDERMSQLSNFVGRKQGHPVGHRIVFYWMSEDQPQRDACKQMYIACSALACHLTRFSLSLRRGVKFPAAARQAADTRVHLTSAMRWCSAAFLISRSRRMQSEWNQNEIAAEKRCCEEIQMEWQTHGLSYDLFIRIKIHC